MRLVLLAFHFLISAAIVRADELLRREVPWGAPINLEEFGAPRIELSIRSRQMSFVLVEIADYTRMVPVVLGDYYSMYGPRVVMQPARESRRIEKRGGVPFQGSRAEMFELYTEPTSGIRVFFLDEIVGQNRDAVVISIPKAPAPPPPRLREDARDVPGRPMRNQIVSPEMLEWYSALQEARRNLDASDEAAVREFNAEAERYHAALRKARRRAGQP